MNSRTALDGTELQRLEAERDAEARRAAAARPVDAPSETAAPTQKVAVAAPRAARHASLVHA